jgi:hypothetical protein
MNDRSAFISYIKNIDSTTREINSLQNSFGQKFIRKFRRANKASSKYTIVPINFEPEKAKDKIINIDSESVQLDLEKISPEVNIKDIDYNKSKEEKIVLEYKKSILKENCFIYRLSFFLGKNYLKFSKLVNKKFFHYFR